MTQHLRETLELGAERHADVQLHFLDRHGHEETRTLAELWDTGRRFAEQLVDLGAGAEDVIAFQTLSWLEGAVVSYAAAAIGATALPIVYVYGPAEVSWVLNEIGAQYFVVAPHADAAVAQNRAEVARDVPTIRAVLSIEREDAALIWRVVAQGRGEPPAVAREVPPDRRLVLYTSGTEAAPKGVQHTDSSLMAEVLNTRPCGHSVTPDEVVLFTGPLGHIGSMYLAYPFAHGLPVVFMDRWNAKVACEAIARHGVTFTHGPPVVVRTLADRMALDPERYRSLRRVRLGGAEIPPDLIPRLHDEFGILGFRTYGSTEHPTTTSGTEDDDLAKRASTDGRPLPGNEVRIVDAEGRDLPAGTEGEIWTRGAELFAGYVNPELDRTSRVDGWYRTGDLGFLDAAGYLTVSGRIKDVIVRGGENIPARRVTEVLLSYPSILDATVVAAKDPMFGERAFAFVVTASDEDISLDEVRRHFAAKQVSRQFVPEGIERVDAMPRNATGKVRREVLRLRASELWAQRTASASTSESEQATTPASGATCAGPITT